MKYLYDDYQLIEAEDNTMNYIILRERQGSYRILVIDWDLSEQEVEDIKDKFESDELSDDDVMNENKDFIDGRFLDDYITFKVIA